MSNEEQTPEVETQPTPVEETPREPKVIPPQSAEKLNQIAIDIQAGRIFCDRHLPEDQAVGELIPMIFMPIALGAFKDWTEQELLGIGMLYEYYDKAGPRAVNGFPSFLSIQMLNLTDAKYVYEKIRDIQKALEGVAPTQPSETTEG